MRKNTTTARYIKHESIKIGDVIKVERKVQDATVTTIGRVARRDRGLHVTEYTTDQGIVLLTHWHDGISTGGKITLLSRDHSVSEIVSLF
jgi:hypothetical protein